MTVANWDEVHAPDAGLGATPVADELAKHMDVQSEHVAA
jgi:hypothetical protein